VRPSSAAALGAFRPLGPLHSLGALGTVRAIHPVRPVGPGKAVAAAAIRPGRTVGVTVFAADISGCALGRAVFLTNVSGCALGRAVRAPVFLPDIRRRGLGVNQAGARGAYDDDGYRRRDDAFVPEHWCSSFPLNPLTGLGEAVILESVYVGNFPTSSLLW